MFGLEENSNGIYSWKFHAREVHSALLTIAQELQKYFVMQPNPNSCMAAFFFFTIV